MKKLSIFWLAMLPTVIAVAPEDTARPPTPEVCPAPIDDTPYITGLETGQVVTQDGATTLRFSSDARACGEWSTEYRSDCRDHWMFHITIPATRLSPGTYELGKIDASFGDLVVRTGEQSGAGCAHECTERVTGIGSIELDASEASLIIDSVNDMCVTGKIRGLRDPHFDSAPDFNGAFFAVRCAP